MLATNRERIAHNRPLRFAKQAKHLTHIVQETRQDKPVGMTVGANGLGGLKQMLKLIQLDIGVRIVDQRVQELHGSPDRHFFFVERQELGPLLLYEVVGLVLVVKPVESRTLSRAGAS